MKETLNPDFSDKATIEKYSSAYTLSDMEIFIFPELYYSLVLANILSPQIWEWREHKWFKNIEKKNFNQKANRIKQFIMDNYVFNLDLETWGLTTKEKEINRFKDFVDIKDLQQSNALFGYEGDKYYFSIDIRKHFGLDKYNSNIIPYWKTETVEAMTAFKYKEEYETGAGECVSLSALYAAAMFIVGRIPLEDIFLVATPLHSQNFIDCNGGLITNNRRIVTKNMWFNGTELSTKARRALENEKVTIVSHISGHIHTLYKDATIDPDSFERFSKSLENYLETEITPVVLGNFLRKERKFWCCFQYRYMRNKRAHYIPLEKIFQYERGNTSNFTSNSKMTLLSEIDAEEFSINPSENRITLNKLEDFVIENPNCTIDDIEVFLMKNYRDCKCKEIAKFCEALSEFIKTEPQLPNTNKNFTNDQSLRITTEQNREEIYELIKNASKENESALLALYTYRDMDNTDWLPFIKSAIGRNPVLMESLNGLKVEKAYNEICKLKNVSIYEGNRLAQPDEIFNYKTGDGIEKAIALASYISNTNKNQEVRIIIDNKNVELKSEYHEFVFDSDKSCQKEITIEGEKIAVRELESVEL